MVLMVGFDTEKGLCLVGFTDVVNLIAMALFPILLLVIIAICHFG